MKDFEGQKRATIENVHPQVNGGKYAVKRITGEYIKVEADIFVDGHDHVDAALLYRKLENSKGASKSKWKEIPMKFLGNDHWEAGFVPGQLGYYEYTIIAWVNYFGTWQENLRKKHEAAQDVKVELLIGAELLEDAQERLSKSKQKKLKAWAAQMKSDDSKKRAEAIEMALGEELSKLMHEALEHSLTKTYYRNLQLKVERPKALFSSWYEFFPRSASAEKGKHGTFKDCEKLLPEIAKMGFDTIYLPPIHPIGRAYRKGKNNATTAEKGDPGSPWAIGGKEGGHKSIHPELGTMEDFVQLVKKANEKGIEVALDFAIQCSPDHPYVKEHPDWFKWRPDGTIQYAENPPKKYQDVLPVYFETEDWQNLWKELKSIVDFWIDKGVKMFRVDNPHTKPFSFWEWLIAEIHKKYPDVIFLAEAFTRPRVMEQLGKIGFTQSYTYFTWRNSPGEFQQYLAELTKSDLREYFRPNFWPNTPDILPISLEGEEEPAFISRLALAATLSSNYGIYGPVFEYGLNEPYPGKEEYIDSEKYEIKHWDWKKTTKTKEIITRINKIRKENAALQSTWHIEFGESDNDLLLAFAKMDQDRQNKLIVIVNMDSKYVQSGWLKIPRQFLGLKEDEPVELHDLLDGSRYTWKSEWNYVELHPQKMPVHLFRIETKL